MPLRAFTNTKTVATVGPSSASPEKLEALILAGVDVFRLNLSHMGSEETRKITGRIRALSPRVAVLLDLQGPKVRLTDVEAPFTVAVGDRLLLRAGQATSTREALCVPVSEVVTALRIGWDVLLDDGLIRLRVVRCVTTAEVEVEVVEGGTVRSRKGVAVPEARLVPDPYLDADDRADCALAAELEADFVAASFVTRASDLAAVREALGEAGRATQLIAKIESRVGVENVAEILAASDGLMVARGDLGVELPAEQVPSIQKRLIKLCKAAAKPVIVATQMLESMVQSPLATRAETSDAANAILDGADALMLSAETSVGRYPIEAVRTLYRIAKHVEHDEPLFQQQLFEREADTPAAFVAKGAARAAEELGLQAVVSLTWSGSTARALSALRPRARILAATPSARIMRSLALLYGVHCVTMPATDDPAAALSLGLHALLADGCLAESDRVAVVTRLPAGRTGGPNALLIDEARALLDR